MSSIPHSWAVPGARCVCISDDWGWTARCGEFEIPVRVPMLGEVLTIREVVVASSSPDTGVPGEVYLGFWEIDIHQVSGPIAGLHHWHVSAFRPLIERKTDIGALKGLPTPSEQREDA